MIDETPWLWRRSRRIFHYFVSPPPPLHHHYRHHGYTWSGQQMTLVTRPRAHGPGGRGPGINSETKPAGNILRWGKGKKRNTIRASIVMWGLIVSCIKACAAVRGILERPADCSAHQHLGKLNSKHSWAGQQSTPPDHNNAASVAPSHSSQHALISWSRSTMYSITLPYRTEFIYRFVWQ